MSLNNRPCCVSEMGFLCKALWVTFEGCCMNRLDPEYSSLCFGLFSVPRHQLRLHSTITFQHYTKRSFTCSGSVLNGTQGIHRKLPKNTFQRALLDSRPGGHKTLGYVPVYPSSLVKHVIDRFLPGSQQKVMDLKPLWWLTPTANRLAAPQNHLTINESVLYLDIYHVLA